MLQNEIISFFETTNQMKRELYCPVGCLAIITAFEEIEKVEGSLKGKTLLDFGSGDLRVSFISQELFGMDVTAADIDKKIVDGCYWNNLTMERAYKCKKVNVICNDALDLDWSKFDIVFFSYMELDEPKEFRDKLDKKKKEFKGKFYTLYTTEYARDLGKSSDKTINSSEGSYKLIKG